MHEARVAVIGGSGLYQIEGLTNIREVRPDTPFGKTSDAIILGTLQGVPIAFLPRHGIGHRLLPSEVPSRANIYALKTLGVEMIFAVSAVGSLKQEFRPQDVVIPDQLIDRTSGRPGTFFGEGIVAHVGFADPFCSDLRSTLYNAAQQSGVTVHDGATWVVMEGPQFSTKAECALHRSWGAGLIGMTALPEAKLAREAEICYAGLACVTDYDCWRDECEVVNTDMILENLHKNVDNAKRILRAALTRLPERRNCDCQSALKNSIATAPGHIPATVKSRLAPIIGKYVST